MSKIYEKLLSRLKNQLERISIEQTDSFQRFSEAIARIHLIFESLRKEVFRNTFQDDTEEIYFFKYIKPEFYAFKFFELERHKIEINKPIGTPASHIEYYKSELKYIKRFFNSNKFFYYYYKHKMTEMDKEYFLRRSEVPLLTLIEVPERSPEFSTPLDLLFAKFIAFERLGRYLVAQIKSLSTPPTTENPAPISSNMKWTGDAINLVEVAYGIWLTGQINSGNTSISEIIRWLEEHFQIKIGRAHRRWTEIAGRKRSSYTKFIDRMQEAVCRRIDDELDLKGKRKKV